MTKNKTKKINNIFLYGSLVYLIAVILFICFLPIIMWFFMYKNIPLDVILIIQFIYLIAVITAYKVMK